MLDTSAISVLFKITSAAVERRNSLKGLVKGSIGCISFVTVGELLFWAEKHQWGGARRENLSHVLQNYVILEPTRDTAEIWAKTKHATRGKNIGDNDLWIASAALEHHLPLITLDADFEQVPKLKTLSF